MIVENIDSFIQKEFSNCKLGDKRLQNRLSKIVATINKNPAISIPNLMNGKESDIKAIYRFFQNNKTTDQNVLTSHYDNTLTRCSNYQGKILLISDSTFISPYKRFDDLKDKGKGKENCLRVHYVLAVSEDGKQIFGITDLRIISNTLAKTNITLKDESDIWILVAQTTVNRITDKPYGKDLLSRCIYITDREGDEFELMTKLRKMRLGFIIRARHNRECVQDTRSCHLLDLEKSAIKHGGKYSVSKKVGNKKIDVDVQRYVLRNISLVPPRTYKDFKNIDCNLVWVKEIESSEGEDISWRLLTDQNIANSSLSELIVSAYESRWIIEEVNKAAKTGASIEKRQFTELDHYKPFIGIIYVIAWRMVFVRNVAEIDKESPIENAFEKDEVDYMRMEAPDDGISTVQDGLMFIARMGGFTHRYDHPGWVILWQGWTKFYERVTGYKLYKKVHLNST